MRQRKTALTEKNLCEISVALCRESETRTRRRQVRAGKGLEPQTQTAADLEAANFQTTVGIEIRGRACITEE